MSDHRLLALVLMMSAASAPLLAADDADCLKACTTYGDAQQKASAPDFKPGFETSAQPFHPDSAGPLYCGCTYKPATSKDPTVNDDSFTPKLVCVASTTSAQVAMNMCQTTVPKRRRKPRRRQNAPRKPQNYWPSPAM